MKVYTNRTNRVIALKEGEVTHFLRIGESIELDTNITDLPEGIEVKTIRKKRKGEE